MYTDKEFVMEAVRRGYCPKHYAKYYVEKSGLAAFDEDDLHRLFLQHELLENSKRKTQIRNGRTSKRFDSIDES